MIHVYKWGLYATSFCCLYFLYKYLGSVKDANLVAILIAFYLTDRLFDRWVIK